MSNQKTDSESSERCTNLMIETRIYVMDDKKIFNDHIRYI